jgi:hypothetical protein
LIVGKSDGKLWWTEKIYPLKQEVKWLGDDRVGVRGLPTEFATFRSHSVTPESGAKLAKTPLRNFQVDFWASVLEV